MTDQNDKLRRLREWCLLQCRDNKIDVIAAIHEIDRLLAEDEPEPVAKAPASLIERDRSFTTWWDAFTSVLGDNIDDCVRDLELLRTQVDAGKRFLSTLEDSEDEPEPKHNGDQAAEDVLPAKAITKAVQDMDDGGSYEVTEETGDLLACLVRDVKQEDTNDD